MVCPGWFDMEASRGLALWLKHATRFGWCGKPPACLGRPWQPWTNKILSNGYPHVCCLTLPVAHPRQSLGPILRVRAPERHVEDSTCATQPRLDWSTRAAWAHHRLQRRWDADNVPRALAAGVVLGDPAHNLHTTLLRTPCCSQQQSATRCRSAWPAKSLSGRTEPGPLACVLTVVPHSLAVRKTPWMPTELVSPCSLIQQTLVCKLCREAQRRLRAADDFMKPGAPRSSRPVGRWARDESSAQHKLFAVVKYFY